MLSDDNLVSILDDLIGLIETDIVLFYKTYRSLPYPIYSEIERLSLSCQKVQKQKKTIVKSKIVANTFHKKFNNKTNGKQ